MSRFVGTALRLFTCLGIFCASALACNPCIIHELRSSSIRIRSTESTVGHDIPVVGAKVRVFRTRPLKQGEKRRQELSCLTTREIGPMVWKGKTDRKGEVDLKHIPAGEYWLAIKGKTEHAVYVITLAGDGKSSGAPVDFYASDIGLVNNKCGIEPIRHFFR